MSAINTARTTTATDRIHNFSAGPAALPAEVLEEARGDIWNIAGSGIGILEHSHRGKVFDRVIEEAEAACRRVGNIPDDYAVLFMQGGATLQNAIVPANLLPEGGTADYLNTGEWSTKSIKEAKLYGNVHVVASSEDENFSYIPDPSTHHFSDNAAYCHFTENNTIFGTEFHDLPKAPAPLVSDASSDIFSRPIDVTKYGVIYAGAQKNLGPAGCALVIIRKDLVGKHRAGTPTLLRYDVMMDKGSRPNTPNTFAIYLMGRVFAWIEREGGLAAMGERNDAKAKLLYDFLDASDFYRATAKPGSRSNMNVCFRCTDEAHEAAFISEATNAGLANLKGHRSVGGMRASIYNAVPMESVEALVGFMKDFASKNG
ncbi:MAG: 3-phosphoserine/phosphohydroxythreonine transaminase [Phycisphaerales bacterium]